MNRLRIALLGPLEVTASDGELYVPQGGPRALLAALALRPGRAVPLGEVVATLWDLTSLTGGTPPADAPARVRAWARRLCAALGPGGAGWDLVQETADGYRLAARDVEVDADTFRTLLAQAAGARDQSAERDLLDRALALWRGAPLAGVTSPQLHRSVVPSLHEERVRAAHRRLELDLRAPRPVPAGAYGCELPPEGRPPGPARPDEDMCDEALDTLFAPEPGGTRRDVVVLHGAAGTGKTALAVRWAHGARALFPDGRFFLDLRGRGPGSVLPSTATGTLLTALGLGGRHLPPTATARLSLLRTALAGRRVLLVLDDAASAAQVRCLLPGPAQVSGPRPRVLVTSRTPLHGLRDTGSARLHLPELAVPAMVGAPAECRTGHAPPA